MITHLPPGFDHLSGVAAIDHERRRRTSSGRRESGRRRTSAAAPVAPTCASIVRDVQRVCASWTSEHGRFELVVACHARGLQVRQSTWLRAGTALEECFLIHTLAEFDHWFIKAQTKFDHPVAHEEVRRFAHGTLSR
jgi:hypothetical protein